MDWVLLAVLVAIWTALLVPGRRGPERPGLRRGLSAMAALQGGDERRVLMPPRLPGRLPRGPSLARRRRRRVVLLLLAAVALTVLAGLPPPLRGLWWAAGALAAVLVLYVAAVLNLEAGRGARAAPPRAAMRAQRAGSPAPGAEGVPSVVVVPLVRGRRTGTGG